MLDVLAKAARDDDRDRRITVTDLSAGFGLGHDDGLERVRLVDGVRDELRVAAVVGVGERDLGDAGRSRPGTEREPEHPRQQQRKHEDADQLAPVSQQLLEVEPGDAEDAPHASTPARATPIA